MKMHLFTEMKRTVGKPVAYIVECHIDQMLAYSVLGPTQPPTRWQKFDEQSSWWCRIPHILCTFSTYSAMCHFIDDPKCELCALIEVLIRDVVMVWTYIQSALAAVIIEQAVCSGYSSFLYSLFRDTAVHLSHHRFGHLLFLDSKITKKLLSHVIERPENERCGRVTLGPVSTSLIGETLDGFANPILPCCMVLENSLDCIISDRMTT